ncbi:hypothetical protein ACIGEP_06110 [Microbacterium sp. NPDC077663]|uniref:hypothetical protein n=1 Tax=Microbacterium sp. NPDC077663 TaxID=3364189 RepID=UPI0037C9B4AE
MKSFPYPPVRNRNHYLVVRTWLGRNALRHIHQDYWKRGVALPSVEELSAWLWDLARKAMRDLPFDKLTQVVDEATKWALTEYNPNADVYVRARRGGSRGITITDADLLAVRELSHAAAAKVLHVSKSTIRRRRDGFDEAAALIPEPKLDWRTDLDRIIAADQAERLSTLDLLEGVII